jgi:hypothetical protein
MNALNALAFFATAAATLSATSFAGDVAPCPDDYAERAATYVESRLDQDWGARVQVVSDPYRVEADLNGHDNLQGWGVDVRVKSRLPGGATGSYLPYTVIFVDGEAVALDADTSDLTRI